MTHQNVITRRQTRESEDPFSDLESLFEALQQATWCSTRNRVDSGA